MTDPISLFSRTISQMCPIFGHAPATGGAGVGLGVGFGVGFGVGLAVGAEVAFAVAVAVGEATADGLGSTLDPGAAEDVAASVELSVGPELADETAAISDGEGEPPDEAPPMTDCSARTIATPATATTAMATGRRERRPRRSTGFSARVPQSTALRRPKRGSCHDRQRGAL